MSVILTGLLPTRAGATPLPRSPRAPVLVYDWASCTVLTVTVVITVKVVKELGIHVTEE